MNNQIQEGNLTFNSTEEYMEFLYGVKRENRIIQFRATFGIGNQRLQPARDGVTRQLLGVPHLSEDQKRRVSYVVDENTSVILEPGFQLNLNDIVHAINWGWLKHCPTLGLSEDDMLNKASCYYYVYDAVQESKQKLTRSELVYEAMGFVKNLSDTKLSHYARLLGERMESMEPIAIRQYLYSLAEHQDIAKIKSILALKSDPDIEIKRKINQLVDKGFIKVINGNLYKFHDVELGKGVEEVVSFYKSSNPLNKDIVINLNKALYSEFYNDRGEFIAPPGSTATETQILYGEVEDAHRAAAASTIEKMNKAKK
jgi:hypothetical protein